MKTLLLSLALASIPAAAEPPAAPAANAAGELTPSRRRLIDELAPSWTAYRNRAQRMMSVYPAAAARAGWDRASLDAMISEVRVLLSQVENTQATTADIAREAVRASEPPSASRLGREKAVNAVFEVRALTLYGNMLPRILDEALQDRNGLNEGRFYAGPEWAVAVGFEEAGAYGRLQIARAGFTAAQYEAFEAQARARLGLPPARP